jgi:Transposase domain (DUF772)
MSLRPEPLPAMPAATVAAVRAAFPKGHLSVDLRAEFGTLSTDQLFPDLYPPEGRPVEVAPWRLALVLVMQYIAGLTDRQAADAVRRCLDGQDALRLDLHAPGFACTLLPDLRERLRAHDAPPTGPGHLPDRVPSAGLAQGARPPTDGFDACAGRPSSPQPPGMGARNLASRSPSAQRG